MSTGERTTKAMKKRSRTGTEVKLDNEQLRGFMSIQKPKQRAREWFQRPPYSKITRGDDIGQSTTNEQQEV